MNQRDYASLDAVNYSTLKDFALSPRRYRHTLAKPRVDTDSMRTGRIDHRAILQPETLADLPVWPGGDRKKAALASFIAANGEDYIWKEQELSDARALSAAVHAHPTAGPLVRTPGECETVLIKADPRTGIMRKARLDKLCEAMVLEVKTTKQPLSERMIQRQITGYAYHAQMAWYLDIAGVDAGKWIFVEQDAPHDVAVVPATPDWIDAGRALYRGWLDRLVECQRTDTWPGLCDGEMQIEVPPWFSLGCDDPGLDMTGLKEE